MREYKDELLIKTWGTASRLGWRYEQRADSPTKYWHTIYNPAGENYGCSTPEHHDKEHPPLALIAESINVYHIPAWWFSVDVALSLFAFDCSEDYCIHLFFAYGCWHFWLGEDLDYPLIIADGDSPEQVICDAWALWVDELPEQSIVDRLPQLCATGESKRGII